MNDNKWGLKKKKPLLHQFSKREKIAFLEKQQYGDNFLSVWKKTHEDA